MMLSRPARPRTLSEPNLHSPPGFGSGFLGIGASIILLLLVLTPELAIAQNSADTATRAFRKAKHHLEQNPGSESALRRVLEQSSHFGGLKAVILDYEKRVHADPQNGPLLLVLAQLERVDGNCTKAIAHYQNSATKIHNSVVSHIGQAQCHKNLNDWAKALQVLQRALPLSKGKQKTKLLINVAETAIKTGNSKAAVSIYEALKKAAPRDFYVRGRYSQLLVRAGLFSKAIEVWKDISRLAPKGSKLAIQSVMELSQLYDRVGKHAEAIHIVRKAMKKIGPEHWAILELQEALVAIYRKQGNVSNYIKELEKGRRTYSSRLLLAQLYEEMGHDEKALKLYKEAVWKRPANSSARNAMLRILKRSGNLKQLTATYEKLAKRIPDEPNLAVELAELYYSTNQSNKASLLLERLSKKYRSDAGVHESILELLLKNRGERAKIEREFAHLSRLEPKQAHHVIQLGDYYYGENDHSKAIATWKQIIKTIRPAAKAYLTLAKVFADHDLQVEAMIHFREAVKLNPTEATAIRDFAAYLERNDLMSDAVKAWKKVMELLKPTDRHRIKEARGNIVRILLKGGTLEYKLESHKRQYWNNKNDIRTGLFLAEAYIQLRDFESAETVLESIVKQRPNDVEALVYLEKVYRNLNRLSDSIGLLQRISKLDPSHAQSRLQEMAQLSMELHRGTDALKYARLVLDLNPNDWKAAERLGDVHVRLGQWADALFAYQRSLANAPQNVPLKFKLAGVLERLGRHDALMEMLSNIVENAMDQNDVLSAGRKLIGNADLSVMPNLEQLLLDQIYRKRRKRIYRKLLVELYRLWVRQTRLQLTSNHSTTSSSETLEHIGRRGLKPLLDSLQEADLSGRTKVLKILMATRNHLAALPLIRLLQTSDKLLRFQVLVTLAHIGTPTALTAIQKALHDTDAIVANAAIWAAGAINDPRADALLVRVPKANKSWSTKSNLHALALGLRSSKAGFKHALNLFTAGPKHTRIFAAWSLGMIGNEKAVEPILRRVPLESGRNQAVLVWALGAIGSKRALEPLLRIVWGKHSQIRSIARWAISQIVGNKSIDRKLIRDRYLSLHDFNRGTLTPYRAFPLLTPWSESPLNLSIKNMDKTLFQILTQQLGQQDRILQIVLLNSLLTPTGQFVLGGLDPQRKMPAAWIPKLVELLDAQVRTRNPTLRAEIVRFWGHSKVSSVPKRLVSAFSDTATSVRIEAIKAMARFPSVDRINELISASREGLIGATWQERATLSNALSVLSNMDKGGQALAVLAGQLNDHYALVRISTCKALQRYGPRAQAHAKALLHLLKDKDLQVVLAALNALGALKSKQNTQTIRKLTRSKNPHKRAAAHAALKLINEN